LTTLDSRSRKRRVVAKAEFTAGDANPRFVVISLRRSECKAKYLYEKVYCARVLQVWKLLENSTDIRALEAFRRQYGAAHAFFDRLAEARVEELKKKQGVAERQRLAMLQQQEDARKRTEAEAAKKREAEKNQVEQEARANEAEAERQRLAMLQQQEEEPRRAEAEAAKKKADDDARGLRPGRIPGEPRFDGKWL
jgi:hypothetical protein